MSEAKREAEFLRDVSAHVLSVARDDGIYRHLVCKQPQNSWLHWFEVTTWPGALCIRGDMGTYVFSRLTAFKGSRAVVVLVRYDRRRCPRVLFAA